MDISKIEKKVIESARSIKSGNGSIKIVIENGQVTEITTSEISEF